MTLFEFLSLKNDVNVASKSHKQKKLCKKITFLLASGRSVTKIEGSGSRILIRIRIWIHQSEAWIRGSGSTPKCHGSATLELRNHFLAFFGVKILKFFDEDPGSGMETVRIRDPGWKKV
jgi:hypothetical protein